MKRFAVIALLVAMICMIVCAFSQQEESDYLRMHIRANSNSQSDQAVKYEVRDAVVALLTPVVAACESREEALSAVSGALDEVAATAEAVLQAAGFSYGARASLKREECPTRVYEGVTLEAGVYDALILELGTGEGDNWWCVVYPPLCFAGEGGDIRYQSRILELIRRFYEGE